MANREDKDMRAYTQLNAAEWARNTIETLFMPPTDCDWVDFGYPSSTTETFTYRRGGSGGDVIKTVTATYTDATKKDLLNLGVA